ncbi:MAG: carboxynorspermidine decarboxylase, partial [Clostridiales bacterium]|nr:carboxynorspermidine decarboxylase [Clostridiales bacterium]
MDEIFGGIKSFLKEGKFSGLKTPCYVIDEKKLAANAKVLAAVISHTGCRILLAQKAFSNYDFYPLLEEHISGTEASGLFEARLGKEEMPGKEVHVFCAAYRGDEFDELLSYADHIVFNSINQLKKFGKTAKQHGKSLGLRINPECSTQEGHEIYDPCATGSRLGVTRSVWDKEMTDEVFSLLDGLHFHTLCEQDSDDLETTLKAVEDKFGDILPEMKWLNMGGGHHITKAEYDVTRLEKIITYAQEKWDVQVYLEPGEAVALNAGYLMSRVLDVVENNGIKIAILDSSAACHMPDVIEMPYTPPLLDASRDDTRPYRYRLAGPSCLSGDVIGDYTFDKELK